jgi:hypothetical protein
MSPAMPSATIFYSWQSDSPPKTNRTLIGDALERAAKQLRADETLAVQPVIDRDVQGVSGSPDIHLTILEKIRNSDAAVFDVSFVHHAEGGRSHPNPNVLLELGYALGTLGWERVVIVLNTATGEPERLPFDIRQKRALTYAMEQADQPAAARNSLANSLQSALSTILKNHPKVSAASSVEAVVTAFHEAKPGAVASLRKVLAALVRDLSAKRLTSTSRDAFAMELSAAFAETSSLVADFGKLATAVVDCQHKDGFERCLDAIEDLANSQSSREMGALRAEAFDVQRLLVREAVLLVAAICLKSKTWPFLRTLTSRPFSYLHEHKTRQGSFELLQTSFSEWFQHAMRAQQTSWSAFFRDALATRYADGFEGIQLNDLREADYFLYLAVELRSPEPDDFRYWLPSLFVAQHARVPPVDWLRRCVSSAQLGNVASSLGLTADVFKARYSERWRRVLQHLPDDPWSMDDAPSALLDPTKAGTAA